jgi:hypothetical protein
MCGSKICWRRGPWSKGRCSHHSFEIAGNALPSTISVVRGDGAVVLIITEGADGLPTSISRSDDVDAIGDRDH